MNETGHARNIFRTASGVGLTVGRLKRWKSTPRIRLIVRKVGYETH